ncbi:MAG TPA: hypothetical protein VIF10_14415 [Methylobacter sp.]|jgi:hypothetical protein
MSRPKRQRKNNSGVSKEIMLRNKTTGQWIKRLDEEVALSENSIPSTLIQIQQNNIYYTDTNLIIRRLVEERHKENIKNLESTYITILDSLDNYRAYSSGVDAVFNNCQQNASHFYNELRRMASEFNVACKDKEINENLINLSKAYIKVLFVYLYSAFSLHKEKVKNDTVIYGKIISFGECIQELLERILIPQKGDGQLDYRKSIYAMFIYRNDFNIEYINELVRYDQRFKTPLALIRELNNNTIRFEDYSEFSIGGTFEKYEINSTIVKFVDSLIKLLRDIDRLKNIREEINNIEQDSVFSQFELQLKDG